MTGHPPGSDGFPGRPGEPPFPGRPGQPPHSPPPHGGFPQPQQPYARQPFPQAPQPYPPSARRRAPLLGGIGAAALLLVSAGVVVWSLSGTNGPYTALPGCGPLVSEEMLATVPVPVRPRVSGEFVDVGDPHSPGERYIEEMEIRGYLQCKVIDRDYREVLWLSIFLHEAHGQDQEAAGELNEYLVGEMEDHRQEWAGGEMSDSPPGWVRRGWRETSTGDGGMVGFYEDNSEFYNRDGHGVLTFVTDNVTAQGSYSLYDSYEESDVLDYMELLSEQMYEQITREAEPA
ncbi:hypothetical protein NE857_07725 [Nocardiopsis exhalans]|uniref:Uncharacterized protein n=1 Tax=Nocardiopsis exhalans TaxID=163604 RepID=A0ABY5DDR2_9ACTN|nr:hypothetical protein [Nocardiopsis exhalans]USY21489.1 hypothetical protein NE857_07725 [Nocardiopsis exhalans]